MHSFTPMLPTFPSHKKGHTLFKKHIGSITRQCQNKLWQNKN